MSATAPPSLDQLAASRNAFAVLLARYARDPVALVQEVLGAEADSWQREVLTALAHGQTRISIRSGHGVGKSTTLAWAMIWFLLTRFPVKIVVTAPSAAQLFDALFGDLRAWLTKLPAAWLALLDIQSDNISLKSRPDEAFISARTSRAENPDSLQGIHARNVMLVVDEAAGVPEQVYEAAGGSMSTPGAITILAGNPTRSTGMFWRSHTLEAQRWFCKRVSSLDSPRVDPAFAREIAERHGTESNQYRVRVLGEFPLAEGDTLIPAVLVEDAMRRPAEIDDMAPEIWGVDVARFGCFDGETEILTDRGWMLFADLTGAERVLTLNGDCAEWGAIEQIHKHAYVGPMNLYEGRSANFCITDNHKLLVRTDQQSSEYVLKRYDDLPKQFMVRSWNDWCGHSEDEIEFVTEKQMPHGGVARYPHRFAMRDWAEFIGWFLSEGNVYTERRSSGRYRIMIAQNPGPKRNRIEALLSRMGIKWRVCSGTGQQMEFTSQAIGRHLLQECGHGAVNKRVPGYIRNGSQANIVAFLDAFRAGDGGQRVDGFGGTYRTTSAGMADDLHEMLAKIGHAGKLVHKASAGTRAMWGDREIVRTSDLYTIFDRTPDGRAEGEANPHRDRYIHKSKARRVPYSGYVWCVSTPLRTIYVRRHGVPMWSGNSDQSCLVKRKGFTMLEPPRRWTGFDTMQLTGAIVAEYRRQESAPPAAIVVDAIGLGAGVADRLRELHLPAVDVNVAESPSTEGRFVRLRDELWQECRDWFDARTVSLPWDDVLRNDLCAPRYGFSSDGKLKIESKDQLRSRGIPSPDSADALCCTFAPGAYLATAYGMTRRGQPLRRNIKGVV